jgi:hypothetical protein
LKNSTSNNTVLVGLTGVAQSGKDTSAKILIDSFGFKRVAFADKLRLTLYRLNPFIVVSAELVTALFGHLDEASPIHYEFLSLAYGSGRVYRLKAIVDAVGWDEAKKVPEVRELLQRNGDDAGRQIFGEDFWIDQAFRESEGSPRSVFTDVRYDNEGSRIKFHGGVIYQVVRPGTFAVNNHKSESGIDPKLVDRQFVNDGTVADLHAKIAAAVREDFQIT